MTSLPLKIFLLLAILALPCSAYSAQNILIFGDSLSAGYGISRDVSWVNLLQRELKKMHSQYVVVNASISGETTSGGLRRITKAMQAHRPALLILELGANDGLRGLPNAETKKNLDKIIKQVRSANAKLLLIGMQLPPNYGASYTQRFSSIYPQLAKTHHIALIPFMLKGIPAEQFQADNLHPNAAAQAQILQNVLPTLTQLLNAK